MGCVYCFTSPSGGQYVGKTVRNFSNRLYEHNQAALAGAKYAFARAIRKYGIENFVHEILIDGIDDNEILNLIEIETIAKMRRDGAYLYNETNGGEGFVGYWDIPGNKEKFFTEEYAANMSVILKERWQDPEYVKNVAAGVASRTEEQKAITLEKHSANLKARWEDPEERKRLTQNSIENWQNPVYKAKHAESMRAHFAKEGTREHISKRLKALWQNPEYRKKRAESLSKAFQNPEVKKRMSEAHRGEKAGSSKITEEIVKEIRLLLKEGISQKKIAAKYGLGQSHISRIKLRLTWTHVPEEE